MDAQIFTTVATGAMLAMFTTILAWQGKGRLDTIERHLDQMRSEIGSLRSEMAVMRSDLTHVALAAVLSPGRRPANEAAGPGALRAS